MGAIEMDHEKQQFYSRVQALQDEITAAMQALDPALQITEDLWTRTDHLGEDGGGGRTRAFRGELFENAGVNTSQVYGALNPDFAKRLGGSAEDRLWAAGISLIIHPRNPRVPTVHANFRMIQLGDKVWFGGGADLTPYYPHLEDFQAFHGTWREVCEPYGHYKEWKAWCDRYFTNTHRDDEMRGIGGIFFDHFSSGDFERDRDMVKTLSERFISSYFPIVERRMNEAYTAEDEEFMLYRRGRYVEFNLIHDRGTTFGLKTKGRTDSILISLPARVRFGYAYAPEPGTPYAEMMTYYKTPAAWA